MEVKKIVEGMTAPQVAQVIDENFNALNGEKATVEAVADVQKNVNRSDDNTGILSYPVFDDTEPVAVGDVRRYEGLLYRAKEAGAHDWDPEKWKRVTLKQLEDEKLSELGSKANDLENKKATKAELQAESDRAKAEEERLDNVKINKSEIEVYKTEIDNKVASQENVITAFKEAVTVQVNNYRPVEINGNVTNAADEEDITSENGLLKLKDRSALNGMGHVILRKNKSFAEQVTLHNTIYEIRYDFDLNGDEVDMPEGCVLDFQGGSLNNGSVNGKNTIIKSLPVKIFNSNITLVGTWDVEEAYPEWFGAEGDGVTDDSDAFNRMFKDSLFPIYSFKNTTYILGNTVYIGGRAERYIKRVIEGNGAIFKPGRNLDVMFKVGLDDLESNETYPGVIDFNSFSVWNNGYSVETIFKIVGTFPNLRNISIQGDTDRQFFNTAIWIQRDWYGSVIEQCTIHFCNKAVVLAGQVNLLHIYKSAILACDYGVYTDDNTYPVMVSHEADDLWIDNCDFEGNTHSIYHNDKLCQITSWKITNNHFEGNKDIEIYIPTKIDSTIFNFQGGVISNNLFLGFKGIIIGTESGGEVFGVLLANNVINGDTSKTVLIRGGYTRNCLEYGNRCSIGITITIYDTFNSNDKPSGSVMVRYENQPILPWGTIDAKGVNGDIRWNEKGIFIKNNLWRFIPAYEFDSSSDIKISGLTSERPTGVNVGFQYFDTTINKPIWWKGGQWVDATGAEV